MKDEIALAGNPNVGKSTIFNALTGLHQHTGNWAGKTVSNTYGIMKTKDSNYLLYDLPGTYSLIAHSSEELVARDYLCFGHSKAIVVVCDAMMLERNLNLVLQTMELTNNVIVCVNLIDEAKKKGVKVNLDKLSNLLGVPVVGTEARSGKGLKELTTTIQEVAQNQIIIDPYQIIYPSNLEKRIITLTKYLKTLKLTVNERWLAMRLLVGDKDAIKSIQDNLGYNLNSNKELQELIKNEVKKMQREGLPKEKVNDIITKKMMGISEEICKEVITIHDNRKKERGRKIDKILTSKITGIPIMLLMLLAIFWLTIVGSNYPSEWLYDNLFKFESTLSGWLSFLPTFIRDMLVYGVYRTVAWVVSVMLPPMAIFFPLFTLLEDLGYLPRIAFNLDKYFKKCHACGKQALCMCMGFGCNAVGVTGARIIDSKRERLIAILTNVFVPCNGRFPMIIALISMFMVGNQTGLLSSFYSALLLLLVIIVSIIMTFLVSFILSKTLLKGESSSFTLELPPYRNPQWLSVIVRSIIDRTLHVLGRAIMIAAPAGMLIYLLSNSEVGGVSLLEHLARILDPFADLIGMDGVILLAFILGFPANEIVIPIILMGYLKTGVLVEYDSLDSLKTILVNNGWTTITSICVIIFTLFHFPCSTTCLTIKKETNSWWYTILSIIIPTIIGITICFIITTISRLIML